MFRVFGTRLAARIAAIMHEQEGIEVNASNDLKRGMKRVHDAVNQVVRETAKDDGGHSHVNVARRTNIKVAKNVGHDGGTAHACATQVAPTEQHGDDQSR